MLEPRNTHRSSAGFIIALLAFIMVLIMAGISAVVLLPKVLEADKANIRFKVADAKEIQITIDGKPVYAGPNKGEIAINDLEPGKHKIDVSADGFITSSDTLNLKSGKDYEIPIALKSNSSAGGTGVALTFEPKDAKVTLDGAALDARSPFEKTDLKAGKYVLIFKKDGFLDEVREINIGSGKIEKIDVKLRPAQVNLQIVSQPEGAEAIVYEHDSGSPDKRQKVKHGKTPLDLPGLDARKVYDVELYLDGYEPSKQVFKPGLKASESVLGKLAPVVAANDPLPVDKVEDKPATDKKKPDAEERERRRQERADRRRAEEERRARILAEADKKPDKRRDPNPDATPPPSGPGYVAIISKPPARVILDGRDIGFTPKLKIELPAGRHRAVLKMESIGVTRSYGFTIKPGTTHMIKGRPPK